MPAELQRPAPRPIRRRGGAMGGCGLIFIRLFILPHMIAGVVLLLMLGHFFYDAMLPGESRWGKILPLAFFALFWNGLLSVFVYMAWIAPGQEKRLYRRGTPVPGRITGKHSHHGKGIRYYVDYEFIQPRFGVLRRRQSVSGNEYKRAHADQLVTVLCWPHKKRPSVIYEYGSFECVSG